MLAAPDVLVVDDSLERSGIVTDLKGGGYRVSSAGTFEQATAIIAATPPHVLVTEVRLGAFNGLHLIIRSRAHRADTIAIVHTAYPDPVLEAEARLLDAEYFARPVDRAALLTIIEQKLGGRPERRKSARKKASRDGTATLMGAPADLIDVSDDGFRVIVHSGELRCDLELRFPTLGLSVRARIVWARRISVEQQMFLVGAQVTRRNRRAAEMWRRVLQAV